jgi:polyhydroxyalkanoate synthesis repressor PhaR
MVGSAHLAFRNSRFKESQMSEPRVIKKYPNRRLYDTVESRYITLADIRRLVVEGIDFLVVDKKSQEDITRTILLQVIAEQEQHGEPLLSRDFLAQVIRSHGGGAQAVVASYLEQSLRLIAPQQHELAGQLHAAASPGVADPAGANAERNYQRWRSLQNDIFRLLRAATVAPAEPHPEAGSSGA